MFIFSIDKLLNILESLPATESYLVAYSGGMDSHVLLHSLYALRDKLQADIRAVHVNHGLSLNAGDWTVHCRAVCDSLAIQLQVIDIDASCPKGESPESWARYQRYAALADLIRPGEILLTAHHKDDQAETLLLQLFRGAGPAGLSAMPVSRSFVEGWHCRPLLEFTREQLQSYAGRNKLDWVEDESNQDAGIDRNYIRHELMPAITGHWPGAMETLARAANHQAEAAALLDQLAGLDLANVTGGEPGNMLSAARLKDLSLPRRKNLLRHWLHILQLPIPDAGNMQHIIRDIIDSKWDATPCVSWNGAEVRRYRDYIYASNPLSDHDPEQTINWNLQQQVVVAHGRLSARRGTGNGLKAELCGNNCIEIRYRRGGETIRPGGRDQHHELKKLLQESAVPPWLRDRIPLLFIDGRFAAVPGKWIDAEFAGGATEDCWQFTWDGIEGIFPKT